MVLHKIRHLNMTWSKMSDIIWFLLRTYCTFKLSQIIFFLAGSGTLGEFMAANLVFSVLFELQLQYLGEKMGAMSHGVHW